MKTPAIFLAITLAVWANGQSLNVDLDFNAPPEVGGGVPSDSFGGASNQPGRWNSVYVIGHADWLYELDGTRRNDISISIDSSGLSLSGGGYRNESNTGDYARLLNDAGDIGDRWRSWTFHGLINGQYRVTTYAVRPFPIYSLINISVNGSTNASVTGPMPGNQFVAGITHVTQIAIVTNGNLEIFAERDSGPFSEDASVNGFQITLVPEPSTVIFLTAVSACFFARRRLRQ